MPHTPVFPNMTIPAVLAPMFLVNGPEIVTAACKSGILGTFPALNNRTTEGFEEWLIEIKKELAEYDSANDVPAAPYGVNLIVHHTNPRLKADLAMVVKHKVPVVITSLGAATEVVDAIHSYGGLVYHDVINRRHAQKATEAGVDGLILVCAGAGGHAGLLHPMAFINEVRQFFHKTILLSGCISTGRDIAGAMQMGADLAYLGTRFINTMEAKVDRDYQDMIIQSGADDIVYTAAVSGVSANFMRKSLEEAGMTKETWSLKKKINFGEELDAEKAESKAWKTIYSAGQGVSSIDDVLPVNQLVKRLKYEFVEAIHEQNKLLEQYK